MIVLVYDSQSVAYTVAAHNLSKEEALDRIDELRSNGKAAFTLDQDVYHPGEADSCPLCRAQVEAASSSSS
ncbi:MAG: hypothetical protein P8Y09_05985 [Deltaproteobacteria bacterium]|jgi:hypothetical protein